jgi:hypothetical protein
LRSNNKKRELDHISLDKKKHFEYVSKNGPQISRYERDAQRLTPSQTEILEEARLKEWSSSDRERLYKLLTTRNVFQERKARKYTRKIRELIKSGDRSQIDSILDEIYSILPESSPPVKINYVQPIYGFARDNN